MLKLQNWNIPPIKEIIPMAIPLILTFYLIYPQALDIAGSSFILLSGVLGLAYYAYHRFPFKEVVSVLIGMGVILFWYYCVSWYNNRIDPYTFGFFKSEIAWFFSTYLIVLFIFKVHKHPTVDTVLKYIVGAVGLQCFITLIMYLNEGIADFFWSIQFQEQYNEDVVGENSWQRLMGYGIAFFGAGANNGVGLVIISYLLVSKPLKTNEFLFLTFLYVLIFYISLFMARTTVVGAGVGFAIIAFYYFFKKDTFNKKQVHRFAIAALFMMFSGYLFVMFYFENISSWAFELFTNFLQTGKLRTRSSDGLTQMFRVPETVGLFLFGDGRMIFRGTDVGFSRMLFYVGLVGSVLFYGYPFFIMKMWGTKNKNIKILGCSIAIYCMILNLKGWFDLNHIFFMIFFYFMFYKYYVYYPKLLKNQPNLRHNKNISNIQSQYNK